MSWWAAINGRAGPARGWLCGVLAFQLCGLCLAGWLFRRALNPDAVAYLQLAAHYARGDFGLAVSGYWSPLISWAIVPLLKLGIQPLLAARIFMIASGVVFMLGCYCLFRRFNLPQRYLRVGLWTAALVSVPWSAENVTPDLLLGGIIGFGVAALATPRWFMRPAAALGCGAVWGIAYLCKAVALPLGLLTCLAAAWFWWRRHRDAAAQVWRSFGLTLLALALVAGPWIGAISAHYGKFTVSNSAVYNHALVGPGEGTRLFLLDLGFHKPPPGRITIWEDPRSPYPDWAPWASWELAWHQVRIILGNLPLVTLILTEISLGFPIAAAFGLAQWCLGRRRAGPEPALMWAWLPVIILAALYVPSFLHPNGQRYFYCTMPLIFIACTRLLGESAAAHWLRLQRLGPVLLAIAFLGPTIYRAGRELNTLRLAGEAAHELAARLRAAGLIGPVAGSGMLPGGRAGLYLAFLIQQPWYGDAPSPAPDEFARSGARIVVVRRGSALARALAAHASFRNLDMVLFGSERAAAHFPLQVFENLSTGAGSRLQLDPWRAEIHRPDCKISFDKRHAAARRAVIQTPMI